MSSKKTIELIKQKIASDEEECFDAFTCFFDIKQEYKDGTYIKNNLDISLIDVVTDEIIETNREAWDLEVNYNEEKDLFEVSHKIKEGYLLEGYEEVYNNDTYAEVYLVDYDPPLLVDIFDYNEYNGELIALDVIEFEEDYEKNYYLKAKNYIFFDNYDGFIEMDKLTKDDINDINEDNESYDNLLEIHDSNYVYNDYYPVKYKIVKEPLEIFYTGDTYLTVEYITESDPFYKHIEIKGHYLEDTLLYDLKKSTTGEFVFYNDVYPPDWYSLDSGVYNLRISVADYFGEKKTKTVTFHFDSVYDWDWEDEVYIMEDDADPYDECMAGIYCYSPSPPPEPEPYVCDDACYIALMKNNSQKWHETDDPNTKAALHAQNVSYSQKLSYSTTYNSHTGTYNKSNGDAIYTKSDLYR